MLRGQNCKHQCKTSGCVSEDCWDSASSTQSESKHIKSFQATNSCLAVCRSRRPGGKDTNPHFQGNKAATKKQDRTSATVKHKGIEIDLWPMSIRWVWRSKYFRTLLLLNRNDWCSMPFSGRLFGAAYGLCLLSTTVHLFQDYWG
jgi:hypothetical protein